MFENLTQKAAEVCDIDTAVILHSVNCLLFRLVNSKEDKLTKEFKKLLQNSKQVLSRMDGKPLLTMAMKLFEYLEWIMII